MNWFAGEVQDFLVCWDLEPIRSSESQVGIPPRERHLNEYNPHGMFYELSYMWYANVVVMTDLSNMTRQ